MTNSAEIVTKNVALPKPAPGGFWFGSGVKLLIGRIVVGAAFVLGWEFAIRIGWLDPFFLGRPSDIFRSFVDQFSDPVFWRHARSTLTATFWGFVIGSGAGTIAGLFLARFTAVEKLLMPYVTALNTMPRVALAPLFILWFGVGINSKIAVAVSLVFFIALANAMAGSRQLDRDLDDLSRFLRCREIVRFAYFVFPVAVPSIFAGLRLGVIYSLLGVVVSEMIAAQNGLGLLITKYMNQFLVSQLFGVLLFLMLISVGLTMGAERLERRLLRWQGK